MRLGELLVERGLARPSEVEQALSIQSSAGGLIGLILVRIGALSEGDLLAVLSDQLGLAIQSGGELPSLTEIETFIGRTGVQHGWWIERQAVAWTAPDGVLICAAVSPLDPAVRGLVEQIAEGPVQ